MLKRQSRHLALLLVLTMLATMFVGVGVAQARSDNGVNKVLGVIDGEDYKGGEGTDATDYSHYLRILEDDDYAGELKAGEVFEIVLPQGVKWTYSEDRGNPDVFVNCSVVKVSSRVAEVTIGSSEHSAGTAVDEMIIPLNFEVDGASGTLAVSIEALDSGVTEGEYIFARVTEGEMTATVDSVKKIARSSTNEAGTIQLRESALNVVDGEAKVVVKLPANFKFESADVTFSGGFSNPTGFDKDIDGRTLTITFTPQDRNQRGTIYITPFIDISRSASFGEVEVGITVEDEDGEIFDGDLVIAEYVDWGIDVKIDDVKELVAGKFEQKTGKLTIEEKVANTLLDGRDLTVELPEWVKITNYQVTVNNALDTPSIDLGDGDQNYIDIEIDKSSDTKKAKIELKLTLSIEGNKSGDIEARIFGAGAEETSLVIATAVAPAIASIDKAAEVKIGVQNQPINDVTFTEGKKGVWKEDPVNGAVEPEDGEYYDDDSLVNQPGVITLSLTEGARFAATPTVTVTDGNFEISAANVRRVNNDTQVEIPVKSESTKASTIKVSDIKLTLDRSIPEGDLKIKIGGAAIIENSRAAGAKSNAIEAGEFNVASIDLVAAKVVTPADPSVHAVSTFVIGNTVYQINGVDQPAMDQAPYIKNDRTYLPVRFVAYGLGIGDNGIIWDEIGRTVTLMKGDKVVQLKIGSTTMLVNGAAITMDTAPEITAAGRTCLPIRFVAEAFGATVGWDAATQTTTITI